MNWTTPADLKQQLNRLWQRGDLLRPLLSPETFTPLALTLKSPSSRELLDQFVEVRQWVLSLQKITGIRIEYSELNHRIHGRQLLPKSAYLDTLAEGWKLINKQAEARVFEDLIRLTRQQLPELLVWLEKRPLSALELADDWPKLLLIVKWFMAHPRPAIYLRQIDIPGVHSKLIEQYRSVLAELLDRVLPAETIQPQHSGVAGFAARYGYLDKPTRVRFRALDPTLCPLSRGADITLDAASFAQLKLRPQQVFITENEVNFLAFPKLSNSLLIFGAGYGWEPLAEAGWLQQQPLYYWGDIDTHGFIILDHLRAYFPHTQSLFMDEATLLAHRDCWGIEPKPSTQQPSRLNSAELQLFQQLQNHHFAPQLRLEQELIGFDYCGKQLARL